MSLSFFLLPHQFYINAHMTFGAICLFLFLALVIHPNASAKPNYVTFVLVVRHAHFFLSFFFPSCSRASLSLPSGCEKCSARAVQLAPRVRTQAAAMLEHIG